MGRKGGGGGTAGGGRSGNRGNVTYRRVVPPFLQGLITEAADESQLGIRRNTYGERNRNDPEEEGMSKPDSGTLLVGDEIAALEKEGFTVIRSAQESNENTNAHEASQGELARIRKSSVERFDHSNVKPSLLRGGIEKKSGHVTRPSTTFKTNDRQKLSFVESDTESSTG